MLSNNLLLIIQILAFFFYLIAFFVSYKIYKLKNYSTSWLFISLAFLISLLRRVLGIYVIASPDLVLPEVLDILDRPIIPFLTGIFFFLGLLGILKEMENR